MPIPDMRHQLITTNHCVILLIELKLSRVYYKNMTQWSYYNIILRLFLIPVKLEWWPSQTLSSGNNVNAVHTEISGVTLDFVVQRLPYFTNWNSLLLRGNFGTCFRYFNTGLVVAVDSSTMIVVPYRVKTTGTELLFSEELNSRRKG